SGLLPDESCSLPGALGERQLQFKTELAEMSAAFLDERNRLEIAERACGVGVVVGYLTAGDPPVVGVNEFQIGGVLGDRQVGMTLEPERIEDVDTHARGCVGAVGMGFVVLDREVQAGIGCRKDRQDLAEVDDALA